jgi:hypothetical protein
MGLLSDSVPDCGMLCRVFIKNFMGTYKCPNNEWDLSQLVQQEGETLSEYIQRFCSRRNTIPDIRDHTVVTLFQKGLRDGGLIKKLARKRSVTSEDMFRIADTYATGEVALREARWKQWEGKHPVQEFTRHREYKRKADHMVAVADQRPARRNRQEDFDCFLDSLCIWHPKGIRLSSATASKGLPKKSSREEIH